MNKKEFITRYGEAAYAKKGAQRDAWEKTHPENRAANNDKANKERSRKGGKHYDKTLKYKHTGIQGDKNKLRYVHGRLWRQYKTIIAPDSQIHHEWIPGTANYRGVALVEADQHMHGFIDVIRILKGDITLLTEKEIRKGGKKV